MRLLSFAAVLAVAGCGGGGATNELHVPVSVFGHTGIGPGEFNYPRAAETSAGDRLYIVDKGGRVQCFNQHGDFIRDWQMPDIQAGKPTGLGIAPSGNLYVADTHYSRVMIFSPDGQRLGEFGAHGDGPGQFRLPTDVAIDSAGFIYVGEYGGNDRISKFSPAQKYLLSFGGPDSGEARLRRPQSIVVATDDTLWVADACNHRICHFDADGTLLSSFGRLGSAAGELRFPYGVDLLSDGTLVVTEYGNNRVQRFDAAGHSLGTWGGPGRQPGQLAFPWAAAAGRDDRVFVIDSGNNRVQVIDGRRSRTWTRP